MQSDSLVTASSEHDFFPSPVTDLCKRVLFRQSECQVCADICPTKAISLPFGPELSDACINCGLCQIACPTEAFDGIQNTDQMLFKILQDQLNEFVNDQKFYVHCHQAEADSAQSISVNCLGNMTENALIAMAAADVNTLMASTGNCSDCQMCEGLNLFRQAASTYVKLSKIISRPDISIQIREKQKISQPSRALSRRDFIQKIGTGAAKQIAKVVVTKEQKIRELLNTGQDTINKKRPSPRRGMLKTLLAKVLLDRKERVVFEKLTGSTFPWKKMLVDEPNCVGCGVCVNVCPTGALVKEINDLELTRTINHSLCTNCGVCAEACPQDIIRFEQTYNIGDIVSDKEEVVAVVALNACCICGEIVPTSEGEVCTTCQKRQVVPMFM